MSNKTQLQKKPMITISLIAIYILNLIDYWQTMYAVRLYGIGVEINPIGRFLLENNYGWVVKFIIMPILLTIVGILVRTDRKMAWVVYVALVWYIAVVAHNFFMILRI